MESVAVVSEAEENASELEMFVAGIVLDPSSDSPIVLLKDETGEICLPIWIGMPEATAIASCLKSMEMSRPMTHDLLKDVLDTVGTRLVCVTVYDLKDNTFLARLELVRGEEEIIVDARPSDAIALAVRAKAQILVSTAVLEEAQVSVVPVDSETAEVFDILPDGEVSLDENFANIDKEKWDQILSEMDPGDFKYKM